jgi:NAD(P)-dependent dehydrogenase (short-subunit alcohol dehydrogenase family)
MEFTRPTLVVGASRGLGRGIAVAIAAAGRPVVGVARAWSGEAPFPTEATDAADPAVPAALLERYDPAALVIVAGASPVLRPLQDQTWETFSVNWDSDVRIAFSWLRETLRRPLRPGSRVVVISSGAALAGSPLSGGYAGAKATQRFLTGYAQDEATRGRLDLTFTAVLPRLTPLTDLGAPAVQAYAARSGLTVENYLAQLGEPLAPATAGAAVLDLLRADTVAAAYLLTAAGSTALT